MNKLQGNLLVRLVAALVTWAVLAAPQPRAQAAFHLWFIKEIYSNPSGSVQFVELFTTSLGQQFLNAHTLSSSTTTFTFPSNSPAPTDNHHLLLATAGFGSISGGATPDFTIPSNFFNPAGDTINFAGVDSNTFASSPFDGINSLNYTSALSTGIIATNSPRNYAGAGGSINLSSPSPTGDYNQNGTVDAADYIVWRNATGQAASPAGSGADGDTSGTIDSGDYTFWRARFGNSVGSGSANSSAAVPEPTVAIMLMFAVPAWAFTRPRR